MLVSMASKPHLSADATYSERLAAYQRRRAEIVRLHDIEQESFAKIAAAMGVSRAAVCKLYWKGKGEVGSGGG